MFKAKKTILITGSSGFIGSFLVRKFLDSGDNVVGIDNMNSYYDPKIKKDRLSSINTKFLENNLFNSYNISLEDNLSLIDIFEKYNPEIVVNLAAQAGVRYSLSNPSTYIQSNIVGFSNLLECCRNYKVKNFIYASSSSVYGTNKRMPYSEKHNVDHPISLYAASKKSNELMAHTYSHLFGIPSTGLRFFTVYGPWGRPDMAPIIFSKAILNGDFIKVFNNGKMFRDFTYISDIVEGIYRCCHKIPSNLDGFDYMNPCPSNSFAPHRIFNIGFGRPVSLMSFIELLEKEFNLVAKKQFLPLQAGDVEATWADTTLLNEWIDFAPRISIEEGIHKFANWFKSYYR